MHTIWLIRSTFGKKEEALSVARTLLEEKRIACANINEHMTALFRWEGRFQQETEVVLLAKTTKANAHAAMARIKELHSYRIPSIIAWQADADENFGAWIAEEVE